MNVIGTKLSLSLILLAYVPLLIRVGHHLAARISIACQSCLLFGILSARVSLKHTDDSPCKTHIYYQSDAAI